MNAEYLEKNRKIILENYRNPEKQVDFEKIKLISKELKVPFLTSESLESGCGDRFHLILNIKKNIIKECFFSAQESCLITVSFANILCLFSKGKKIEDAKNTLINCSKMIEGKDDFFLKDESNLNVFSNLFKFPHRIECVNIVLRSFNSFISN